MQRSEKVRHRHLAIAGALSLVACIVVVVAISRSNVRSMSLPRLANDIASSEASGFAMWLQENEERASLMRTQPELVVNSYHEDTRLFQLPSGVVAAAYFSPDVDSWVAREDDSAIAVVCVLVAKNGDRYYGASNFVSDSQRFVPDRRWQTVAVQTGRQVLRESP